MTPAKTIKIVVKPTVHVLDCIRLTSNDNHTYNDVLINLVLNTLVHYLYT